MRYSHKKQLYLYGESNTGITVNYLMRPYRSQAFKQTNLGFITKIELRVKEIRKNGISSQTFIFKNLFNVKFKNFQLFLYYH